MFLIKLETNLIIYFFYIFKYKSSVSKYGKRCGTAGLVCEAHNLKVGGSNPLIALF